jgi:NTE family protein
LAKTLGLALGTGGARGWAHIGVIRALEEANIKIDYLAGTSIGSLVGAIYLAGALDKLEGFAQDADLFRFQAMLDIAFPAPGLMKGEKVYEFIADYVGDQRLEDASIPFRCVATNFLRKQEVVMTTGLMADAVRASISIPGIFQPFKQQQNIYLVDGGIINPLPVSVVQDMGADVVVGVNLNQDLSIDHPAIATPSDSADSAQDASDASITSSSTERVSDATLQNSPGSDHPDETVADNLTERIANRYDELKENLKDEIDRWIPDKSIGLNIFDVLGESINVMEKRVTEANLLVHKPDVLIAPDLAEFGTFDFHKSQAILPRGYEAAKAMLPEIENLLS